MELNRISRLDGMPDSALLSAREIAEIFGVNEKTVWRWVGKILPDPQRIGTRCTRWPVGEVRKVLAMPRATAGGE